MGCRPRQRRGREFGLRTAGDRRARCSRPAGRVPRMDPARRDHRGGIADAGQDPTSSPGTAHGVRRFRPGGAGRSRLSSPVSGPTSSPHSRPVRDRAPATSADVLRAARGNADLLRDAASYRAKLVRHRVPLRYGRIVVRAEGDRRVERVVHAAVDGDWQLIPGTEESIDADLLCLGLRIRARRRSCSDSPAASSTTTSSSAGRWCEGRLGQNRNGRRLRGRRRDRCRGLVRRHRGGDDRRIGDRR